MKRAPKRQTLPPQLAHELLESLLHFVEAKFYPGHPVPFAKDKPRLLSWVILWPAAWLAGRGVTLPPDRYRNLIQKILIQAQANSAEEIKYLPAWLRQVVQSHFRMHGDEIYDEAKAIRNLTEQALKNLSVGAKNAPDPVTELARINRLLNVAKKPLKTAPKIPASQGQLL